MEDVERVQVADSLTDFCHFAGDFSFRHMLGILDQPIERAFFHVLHENVEVKSVVKETIEFDHISVVQEQTDLHLLDELLQHQSH